MLYPDGMTICKLGNQVLFEIHRKDAAALKTTAELYTPSGYFVKYADKSPALIDSSGDALKVGGFIMSGNVFMGCRIGVWLKSDGSCSVGCN
jgi:hypothetical protein